MEEQRLYSEIIVITPQRRPLDTDILTKSSVETCLNIDIDAITQQGRSVNNQTRQRTMLRQPDCCIMKEHCHCSTLSSGYLFHPSPSLLLSFLPTHPSSLKPIQYRHSRTFRHQQIKPLQSFNNT